MHGALQTTRSVDFGSNAQTVLPNCTPDFCQCRIKRRVYDKRRRKPVEIEHGIRLDVHLAQTVPTLYLQPNGLFA